VTHSRLLRPSREDLIEALERAGSVTATATALGVSRKTVHVWIRDLEITVQRGVVKAA
jgi:molybdenum-dependent DNA-binding transcriptional regulator ModE